MRKRVEACDRFWLLTLAMGSLFVIGGISLATIYQGVPEKVDVLLGVIVGGLLLFMREIVQAIRSFWEGERTTKLTDQLAAAAPTGSPIDANIVNPPSDPVPVETKP